MDNLLMLPLKYTIFAAISILVNLLFQFLTFQIYNGYASIYIAMLTGTFSGLIVKYILDKNWIFYHHSENKVDDVKKFTLYSFMGLFTTAIFWVTELSFEYIFAAPSAKYIGAVFGLIIGYIIKYQLDRNYVFTYKTMKSL